MPAPYRTVREEKAFTRAIGQIAQRYPRVREVVDAITWLLARTPEKYFQVPDTKYHLYVNTDLGIPGIPVIRVFYWYDDDMVYLVDAMLVARTPKREQ